MSVSRIVGLVLMVLGIALLAVGINAADSAGEQLREAFTGRFSEGTTWYMIGGIVAIVAGGALALFGRPTTAS